MMSYDIIGLFRCYAHLAAGCVMVAVGSFLLFILAFPGVALWVLLVWLFFRVIAAIIAILVLVLITMIAIKNRR